MSKIGTSFCAGKQVKLSKTDKSTSKEHRSQSENLEEIIWTSKSKVTIVVYICTNTK